LEVSNDFPMRQTCDFLFWSNVLELIDRLVHRFLAQLFGFLKFLLVMLFP
jgi:hypothetical protein